MDIIEKAKELGESISLSEEMKKMKEHEINVQNDSKAMLLINEFNLLQAELTKAVKQDKDKQVIDNIRKMVLDKQNELNDYEITKKFVDSKNKFDMLVKRINDVIIFSITGESKCSSDGCSSCSGCK